MATLPSDNDPHFPAGDATYMLDIVLLLGISVHAFVCVCVFRFDIVVSLDHMQRFTPTQFNLHTHRHHEAKLTNGFDIYWAG